MDRVWPSAQQGRSGSGWGGGTSVAALPFSCQGLGWARGPLGGNFLVLVCPRVPGSAEFLEQPSSCHQAGGSLGRHSVVVRSSANRTRAYRTSLRTSSGDFLQKDSDQFGSVSTTSVRPLRESGPCGPICGAQDRPLLEACLLSLPPLLGLLKSTVKIGTGSVSRGACRPVGPGHLWQALFSLPGRSPVGRKEEANLVKASCELGLAFGETLY